MTTSPALLAALARKFGRVETDESPDAITYRLPSLDALPTVNTLHKWNSELGLDDGAVWGWDSREGYFVRVRR